MRLIHAVLISMSCLILFGCSDSDDTTSVSYEGNWYNTSADSYLEITNSNTALFRECSVNNGYQVVGSGELEGDSIPSGSFTYKLLRAGNKLTLSAEGLGDIAELILQSSIPSVCTGDAIEITFGSPTSATEGILTTFTVNFDYRLISRDSAIVYFGFNTSNSSNFTLTDNTFEITQAESGSGSLTADIMPVFYDSPDSFSIYVNISENPHPDVWAPLSSDNMAITVTQSGVLTSNNLMTESINQVGNIELCSNNPFVQCVQERK